MALGNTGTKNENMTLWILDEERERNRTRVLKEIAQKARDLSSQDGHHCRKCEKSYETPKMIYVCPHCLNEIEETAKIGCRYWFGYLNQKDKTESVPQECVECEKVMDCMLSQENSEVAMSEIRKWY
jgi:hypothetical protein